MAQATYQSSKKENKVVEYETKETNGHLIITSDNMTITLFKPNFTQDPGKGSEILFTASIRIVFGEEGSIAFKVPVVKSKRTGNTFIGKNSDLNGHQAVLSTYNKKKERNYEDLRD